MGYHAFLPWVVPEGAAVQWQNACFAWRGFQAIIVTIIPGISNSKDLVSTETLGLTSCPD